MSTEHIGPSPEAGHRKGTEGGLKQIGDGMAWVVVHLKKTKPQRFRMEAKSAGKQTQCREASGPALSSEKTS